MAAVDQTDSVVIEAYQLSRDYIAYVTGKSIGPAPSAATAVLRQAGDELLEKFPIFFKRWPRVFNGVTENEACDFLIQILEENFKQQRERQHRHPGYPPELAWSSILSIYVLAGQMAIYCQEHGMEGALGPLAERVGHYVEENVCPVIRAKNGWGGFSERFRKKEDIEKKALKICCGLLLVCSALILTHFLWRRKMPSS
ncbi:bcl-2-related ovarian killer protein homolog A-like [Ascaphus truei]|uniref:bcl-2-related ovarian killer protein homolog A-like n=1 Tax=Ascaphus truei TaxID=8439 RepID=UPI003F5A10A3